ncbi:copper transporter family protein [Sporobolomyces salmoneus]|uniref:copper transporter family protein n=1 Tax=Sporobolomyces salmoneus TaxID=183962 RepID=UPI0031773570
MDTLKHLLPRHAGHDGMDMGGMNMGQSNSTSVMMMSTYFTTSLGASNLWFSSWTPTSPGSTFGACLGLFFLAILSRFLAAVKSCAEVAWARSLRQQYLLSSRPSPSSAPVDSSNEAKTSSSSPPSPDLVSTLPVLPPTTTSSGSPTSSSPSSQHLPPFTPPFYLSIDLPRSILFALQSFIAYLLMLAVMSYSAWFFIAIMVGLTVGELAFGRFVALLLGAGHHGAEHL